MSFILRANSIQGVLSLNLFECAFRFLNGQFVDLDPSNYHIYDLDLRF
jgi:hypothetical protein